MELNELIAITALKIENWERSKQGYLNSGYKESHNHIKAHNQQIKYYEALKTVLEQKQS
jgi:transposase-like protein